MTSKQVRVDADTHAQLRRNYGETGIPMSVQIREAVRKWLAEQAEATEKARKEAST